MSTRSKKLCGFAAVVFGILVSWTAVAHTDGIYNRSANSVGDTQGIDSAAASTTSIPLAFDGTSVTANSSAGNLALPGLTTTLTNNVIVVSFITNGAAVTSVTSPNLTFVREPGLTPPSTGITILDIYTAVAASPLTNEVITIHSNPAFTTGLAFALNGAKTSAPFDINGAIPSTTSSAGAAATITTSASNTFAFGITVDTVDNHGAGYIQLNATALSNSLAFYYRFASTTLSASQFETASVPGSIATAIVKGP